MKDMNNGGQSKGYAFVAFETHEEALNALRKLVNPIFIFFWFCWAKSRVFIQCIKTCFVKILRVEFGLKKTFGGVKMLWKFSLQIWENWINIIYFF